MAERKLVAFSVENGEIIVNYIRYKKGIFGSEIIVERETIDGKKLKPIKERTTSLLDFLLDFNFEYLSRVRNKKELKEFALSYIERLKEESRYEDAEKVKKFVERLEESKVPLFD